MDRTLAGDWDARVEHRSMAETRMRTETRNGESAEAARSTEHRAVAAINKAILSKLRDRKGWGDGVWG